MIVARPWKVAVVSFGVFLTMALTAGRAEAISITVNSNCLWLGCQDPAWRWPNGGTFLYEYYGYAYPFSFDINSALPASMYQQPYKVVSASMQFSFQDDGKNSSWQDGESAVANVVYLYTYNDGPTMTYKVKDAFYIDDYEAAYINSSAGVINGATTYFNAGYGGSQTFYEGYDKICNDVGGVTTCHPWYFHQYSIYNTYYSGYSGGFSLAQSLNQSGLDDLAADGVLDFTITPIGDLILNSATLTVEVQPVPEPTSLLLLGAGLIGLTVHRLRG